MTALWIAAGALVLLALGLLGAVVFCTFRSRSIGNADCLVVLGARIHPDGRMSTTLVNRCEAAVAALERGVPVAIVCGGRPHGGALAEADCMREALLRRGVDSTRILVEDASVNTWENMVNAGAIMKAHNLRAAAVVTSDYHVTRALWMARDVGLPVVGAVAAPSKKNAADFCKRTLRESVSWVLYQSIRLRKRFF